MPVIEWRQTARADLLTIVDYISDDNPDAAQQFKDDIEAKVAKLAEHPKLYRPGRVAGTREMIVRRNYVVVYAEDDRVVSILRVLHAAQQLCQTTANHALSRSGGRSQGRREPARRARAALTASRRGGYSRLAPGHLHWFTSLPYPLRASCH